MNNINLLHKLKSVDTVYSIEIIFIKLKTLLAKDLINLIWKGKSWNFSIQRNELRIVLVKQY